jgi:hypothetical protein
MPTCRWNGTGFSARSRSAELTTEPARFVGRSVVHDDFARGGHMGQSVRFGTQAICSGSVPKRSAVRQLNCRVRPAIPSVLDARRRLYARLTQSSLLPLRRRTALAPEDRGSAQHTTSTRRWSRCPGGMCAPAFRQATSWRTPLGSGACGRTAGPLSSIPDRAACRRISAERTITSPAATGRSTIGL